MILQYFDCNWIESKTEIAYFSKNCKMSHLKERKEKDCLNCGAKVLGRYCQNCGQENIEPKESFIHLLGHLVSHEFHFDSKIFSTAKHLLLTPGFLTKEYMAGRRVSYLDPIRMYIFLSAFFFLVVFSFGNEQNKQITLNHYSSQAKKEALATLKELKSDLLDSLNEEDDSLSPIQKHSLKERAEKLDQYEQIVSKDSVNADSILKLFAEKEKPNVIFMGNGKGYKTLEEYDSAQNALPQSKKDNFIVRSFNRKGFEMVGKFRDNPKEIIEHIKEEVIHSFSEIFFLSLPLFAFILQLLYLRNRKNFYYVNHFIYTLHLYSGTFFIYLVFFLTDRLKVALGWPWINYVLALIMLYWIYFSYKSLRTYYGQKRGKTIVKFLILSFFSSLMFVLLIGLFSIISAYKA